MQDSSVAPLGPSHTGSGRQPHATHRMCWARRCRPGSHPHHCTSGTPGYTSPRRTASCQEGRRLWHTELMSGGQTNTRWAQGRLWVHDSWGGPTKHQQVPGMLASIPRGAGAQEGKVPLTSHMAWTGLTPLRSIQHACLPQTSSSEESPQLSIPLHFHSAMMHTLFLHCHCPGRQGSWGHPSSSQPSSQSWCRSHSSQCGMQWWVPGHCTFFAPHTEGTEQHSHPALCPRPPPLSPPQQRLPTAVLLIRAIQAVSSTIATPAARNTPAVVTLPNMGVPTTGNICRDST